MRSAAYVDQVLEVVKKRNPGEPEFFQAVQEGLRTDALARTLMVHPSLAESLADAAD